MRTTRFNPIRNLGTISSAVLSTGGFGSYHGEDDNDIPDDDDTGGDDDLNQDDNGITLDDDTNALDDLFKPKEGEEGTDDSDDDDDDITFPTQEEVTTDLKAVLEGYAVPDDLIPEDLDLSDRKQVRDFATNIGRHAVTQALSAMFKPIQIAMSQQQHELRKEIKASVRGGFQQSTENTILAEVIPAIADPAQKDVIMTLFNKAKAKHPKDVRKAAQVTRAALVSLGVNPNGRKNAKTRSSGNALNSYAPLPQLDTAQKPNQRNQQRLKR